VGADLRAATVACSGRRPEAGSHFPFYRPEQDRGSGIQLRAPRHRVLNRVRRLVPVDSSRLFTTCHASTVTFIRKSRLHVSYRRQQLLAVRPQAPLLALLTSEEPIHTTLASFSQHFGTIPEYWSFKQPARTESSRTRLS
jgi:hypothetical protein